jgi:hypothetical protein
MKDSEQVQHIEDIGEHIEDIQLLKQLKAGVEGTMGEHRTMLLVGGQPIGQPIRVAINDIY